MQVCIASALYFHCQAQLLTHGAAIHCCLAQWLLFVLLQKHFRSFSLLLSFCKFSKAKGFSCCSVSLPSLSFLLKMFLSLLKTATSSEGFCFLLFIFMLVTFYFGTRNKRAKNPASYQSLWNRLDVTVHYIYF